MKQEKQAKLKRLNIAAVLLAVLLAVSALALAALYGDPAFFTPAQTTAAAPDNLVREESARPEAPAGSRSPGAGAVPENQPAVNAAGSSGTGVTRDNSQAYRSAAKLELYRSRPEDNRQFEVTNMLPGDKVTKYFCVKVRHNKDLDLYFKAKIIAQTKNLGDVLRIKVTHLETGKVLCDAPFAEVNGKEFAELLKKNTSGQTTANYQIDVSLAASVGNEYQAAELTADFMWAVKDGGGLTPPQTGDNVPLALWVVLAGSALLLLLLLPVGRRKEGQRHEQA